MQYREREASQRQTWRWQDRSPPPQALSLLVSIKMPQRHRQRNHKMVLTRVPPMLATSRRQVWPLLSIHNHHRCRCLLLPLLN